jgi:hypothetical protein
MEGGGKGGGKGGKGGKGGAAASAAQLPTAIVPADAGVWHAKRTTVVPPVPVPAHGQRPPGVGSLGGVPQPGGEPQLHHEAGPTPLLPLDLAILTSIKRTRPELHRKLLANVVLVGSSVFPQLRETVQVRGS